MKKPLLYSNPKYFKLLKKYRNLYTRLKDMFRDGSYYNLEERVRKSLFKKFKLIYQRLTKMQLSLGIKTAGIAMAFMLVSNIADAQMPKKWIENEKGTALFNSGIQTGRNAFAKFVDIDNDGDEDMFVGSYYDSEPTKAPEGIYKFKFFENKGPDAEEQFVDADNPSNPILPATNYGKPFVDFMDNDGDGDLDAFVVNPNMCGSIDFYKNVGTQSAPQFELNTGSEEKFPDVYGVYSIAFEDIDGDDDLDAVFGASYCGIIRYFENNAGAFTEQPSSDNPFTGISLYNTILDFQDLDGDDDIDAVAAYCGSLYYLENTPVAGEADFNINTADNPFGDNNFRYPYPCFEDLDEDGDMDLMVSNFDDNNLKLEHHINVDNVFTNNGAPDMIPTPIPFDYVQAPLFVDLDGDGDLDLYIDDKYYSDNRAYKNVGTITEPELELSTLGNFGLPDDLYYTTEAFVDIDNDGDLDMFTLGYYMPASFYKNVGTTTEPDFQLQDQSNNPLAAAYGDGYINSLGFADLDGDGDFDAIVGAEYDNPTLTVFKNTGTKEEPVFTQISYSENPFDGVTDTPFNIDFVDFDEDGDPDLIFGTYGGPTKSTGAFLVFDNISTDTDINFEALVGADNPLDTINTAISSFGITKLFNEDEISFVIRESIEEAPTKKSKEFDIVRYYSYKDLLGMANTTLDVDENTAAESVVTAIEAEYYGEGTLSYTLDAGAETVPFDVNTTNLIVAAGATLDYENLDDPTFEFTIQASDGTYDASGTFTVNVINLNDNSPVLTDKNISIDENAAGGTILATLDATDADNLGEITYSIDAGEETIPFDIDAANLIISSGATVDYELLDNPAIAFNVVASDGENEDEALFTITVNNLNDNAPVLEDQTINMDENPSNADLVATLNATDADNLGALTYSITAGNTDDAFEISTNTIVVKTASVVDYETVSDHRFILNVEVSDGELTDNATITVNINDVDETTGIEDILKNNLVFYPNPAHDELNIMIGSELQGEINLKIVNSIGNVVKTATYESQEEFRLDVSNLSSGIYFIQVSVDESSVTKRIIIK